MTVRAFNVSISDFQAETLDRLIEYSVSWLCVRFKDLEPEDEAKRAKVRIAVRALARKGLVVLSPAFDDDGRLVGSGYLSTPLGDSFLAEIRKQERAA